MHSMRKKYGFKRLYELSEVIVVVLLVFLQIGHGTPNINEHQRELSKTILVFGGNGFLGAATVENLLRVNYSVILVNRGNWYWDTSTTVQPFVTHLKCDRMQSLQKCSDLQHYLWSPDCPTLFDAVIDFSGYHPFEISDAFDILKGKILRYIYISSDSVYEVCNKTHDGFTREEDAVRPELIEDQELYNTRDDYGNRKMKCEEELEKQAKNNDNVPYVILRLPDVVGPRDNTYRWWIYQLWIRLHDHLDKPLSAPHEFWDRPMSLVYVYDVADVILDVLDYDNNVYNQAYNLANKENPTIVAYLHDLMDSLDVEDLEIQPDEDARFRLFPSVTLGPVDTTKACRVLGWNPTSWTDIVHNTTMFYENAMKNEDYSVERRSVVKNMQDYFSEYPSKVNRGLKDVYDVILNSPHDEL